MSDPSPRSHLYRLALVLLAALVVFLGIAAVAMPASWNFDMGYWHRADALEDMKQQPLIYGGIVDISVSERNQACRSCHKGTTKTLRKLKHKALSCESCHEARFDHVREGRKIADAGIDRSTWQCLNCHDEYAPGTTCLKCHDAHDPTT
jgi:Zn finger protein HypA/HybF involved in hydrogenase expression